MYMGVIMCSCICLYTYIYICLYISPLWMWWGCGGWGVVGRVTRMFDPWRLYRQPRAIYQYFKSKENKAKYRRKMEATNSASFGAYRAFQKQSNKADEADEANGADEANQAAGVVGYGYIYRDTLTQSTSCARSGTAKSTPSVQNILGRGGGAVNTRHGVIHICVI